MNFDTGKDSWFYNNDPKNRKKYGMLYTWEAANKACLSGWRLPSDSEWWNMVSHYGKACNRHEGQEKNNTINGKTNSTYINRCCKPKFGFFYIKVWFTRKRLPRVKVIYTKTENNTH